MTEASLLQDPSSRLTTAFARVLAERMRGLPFVNPALRVEAVAFAPWKHYWLGVMLTPWAMNLLLAPRNVARWRSLPAGEKRRYVFPAGEFDFISAHDEMLGEFLICSLFSPVLQFTDHATACETARLAKEALFDATHADVASSPEARERHEREGPGRQPITECEARLTAPLSRRNLLHGQFGDPVDEPRE